MMEKELIIKGRWSIETLDELMKSATAIDDIGARIDFLSRRFLGTPYLDSTLIGDEKIDEIFVINLSAMDCLTFLEYIEAMRLSSSFADFKESLKKLRYCGGAVSYETRNHFFSDWREFNDEHVEDVTKEIGLQKTKKIRKVMNLREEGSCFVSGIDPVQRDIEYVPSTVVDDLIIDRMKTGDYVGIYSDLKGLDVSHVGIFIRGENSLSFRHASSTKENRKVIDQDFAEYVRNKPGIIVLRPKR